jgi:hypothetical protein
MEARKGFKQRINMCRARDRTVLSDQQVVLNHWAEHLTELFDGSIIPERDAKSEDLVVSIEELLKIDKAPAFQQSY